MQISVQSINLMGFPMRILSAIHKTLLALGIATLAACGGGSTTAGGGTMRFALTDAPACGYDAVNITVQKVRVHQSASAADADGGWSEVVLNPAKRIDLLKLTNGVLDELGQTALPTGRYTQLRLVLASNDASNPFANSVLPTGGSEVALKTPSGQQSGVKANVSLDVAADKLADFVIDFDACKSVVSAGNSGQYLLKPVVSVIPRYVSGVSGFVHASVISPSTTVSLQQAGATIKATTPDSTGKFTLQPVAPGSYTLVVTASGRITTVVTGVPVAAEAVTNLNTSTTALNPGMTATGLAQGNAPADTFVRALQPLSGGLVVEVAGRFVDGSGGYSYPLPLSAAQVASYVVAPLPLVFSQDTASVNTYRLSASLSGFSDKSVTLPPLTASATTVTNFTFP